MTPGEVLVGLERDGILAVVIEPDPGCYGCLGTGLIAWGAHPRVICSCITCDKHHPDPCDCLDLDAIEIVLLARERDRHPATTT